MTDYVGIDYGLGRSNVDRENGIRYGVISMNSIMPECTDDFEQEYGDPHCPKCGNRVTDELPADWRTRELPNYSEHGCDDYVCTVCEHMLDSSECFPDEAIGWHYDREGYKLTGCLDNDIFVLGSPYYTHAQFCSPCVPGAGNLDTPVADGPKTYCLGHDWFDGGKAPYPVFKVADDTEVRA